MGTHIEQERKFDVTGAAAGLPDLRGLPGVATVGTPVAEELDAVYYDTVDHLLQGRRITLRRRTGGHDEGWHLKLPEGPDTRREIQLPLDGAADGDGSAAAVPEALALRIRARAHGRPLAPVARLQTHRNLRVLLDDANRPLAEIAEDTVTARALGRTADGGTGTLRKRKWSEVEAELSAADGDVGLLDAIEARFAEAGLRRSASASKLERALGAAGPATAADGAPVTAPDGGSIGALLVDQLRAQVEAVLVLDGAVRRDRPDSVHGMRIAVRRLRTTLRAFGRYLDRTTADALDAELRLLGRVLGEARDSEVLGSRLDSQAGLLTGPERPGPVRRRIRTWCADQYRQAHGHAVAELDAPRYFTLVEALDRLAAAPVLRARAGRDAGPELRRVLAREQRRVGRRVSAARGLPPGAERDEELHAARKAAKRARYAGELAAVVAGRPARRFARRMKALQTVLGDRQDAILARRTLPEIAAAAHAGGEPGFGYGVLYAGQAAAIAQADADLPALWAAARRRKLTRRIG